jgi:uncharacterized Zn finger protein (UPF0148 family)
MGEVCYACGTALIYKGGYKWCPRCQAWVDWSEVPHVG